MKTPPFCPNKACPCYHQPPSGYGRWYRKRGFYHTNSGGTIQRYECRGCGRSFSTQTFSIDYMTKKRLSYKRIHTHLVTCSGMRDIARDLKVSPSTILNRISRLARQSVAVHCDLSSRIISFEALAADGFESFAVSQYFPNNIHLLAGSESQFWYATDYAHLRRKGRMTKTQKRKNARLQNAFISGRTTIYSSFTRILEAIDRIARGSGLEAVTLCTDEHVQYRRVIAAFRASLTVFLRHLTIPSQLARTVLNLLFAVNYLDREIRKDCAEHVRETMKYARNVSNSLERLALYRFYHNYMKPYRIGEAEYEGISHAMKAGLDGKTIAKELKTFYTQRRFLYRTEGLSFSEALVWLRGVATPLKRYAEYLPAYAWD